MKAADFHSAFNPIIQPAMVGCGGARVGRRQSVWNIVDGNEQLVLRFATNYKYPWTESDGGTFNLQGWRVPRTRQGSMATDADIDPFNGVRVFDYLDEALYSEMLEMKASIDHRSPLAMAADRYASELRRTLQAQGIVHPDNPRLDTSPDLRYFDSRDVGSWGDFFSRALPVIINGARADTKYIFTRPPLPLDLPSP